MNVTELNKYVKNLVSNDPIISNIEVIGEISGYKKHSSGHIYFTLKDEGAAVRCAFFKPYSLYASKDLKDGAKVRVRGSVTIFERDGQYQLNVYYVSQSGIGDLHYQFELLKKKLYEEGLFDSQYKKPIPKYVKKIGVVTSPTGAVFRDIVNVSTRRCPNIEILLAPVSVQGEDAPRSICAGLAALDERNDIDVIIVGRGGGSIEDLWCFNDENVARCIFQCKTPIISAVGHETDFTISDFVADLRAPTPSAAAELAVFDYYDLVEEIDYFERNISKYIDKLFDRYKNKIQEYSYSFEDPKTLIDRFYHKLEILQLRLFDSLNIEEQEHDLKELSAKLDALSPLKVLGRGYSVVHDSNGKIIKNSSQVNEGDEISITLSKGEIKAEVHK